MITDPDKLINDWVNKNPTECAIIASAVLYAFFNDSDTENGRRIFNFKKEPDLLDVHNEIIEAIRCTTFASETESQLKVDAGSYWT